MRLGGADTPDLCLIRALYQSKFLTFKDLLIIFNLLILKNNTLSPALEVATVVDCEILPPLPFFQKNQKPTRWCEENLSGEQRERDALKRLLGYLNLYIQLISPQPDNTEDPTVPACQSPLAIYPNFLGSPNLISPLLCKVLLEFTKISRAGMEIAASLRDADAKYIEVVLRQLFGHGYENRTKCSSYKNNEFPNTQFDPEIIWTHSRIAPKGARLIYQLGKNDFSNQELIAIAKLAIEDYNYLNFLLENTFVDDLLFVRGANIIPFRDTLITLIGRLAPGRIENQEIPTVIHRGTSLGFRRKKQGASFLYVEEGSKKYKLWNVGQDTAIELSKPLWFRITDDLRNYGELLSIGI